MDSFHKCEKLLINYNNYKLGLELDGGKVAKKCIEKIDRAIDSLENEPYIELITMHYINKLTMERIAEIYDVSLVTVYAQKKKLVRKLACILCSDDSIKELLTL